MIYETMKFYISALDTNGEEVKTRMSVSLPEESPATHFLDNAEEYAWNWAVRNDLNPETIEIC
jgi:hypothetical protein